MGVSPCKFLLLAQKFSFWIFFQLNQGKNGLDYMCLRKENTKKQDLTPIPIGLVA